MSQGKGSKNNRVKDWNAYWANLDSIFSKDKEKLTIQNLPQKLEDTPPEAQKILNENFQELIDKPAVTCYKCNQELESIFYNGFWFCKHCGSPV